MNLKLLARIEEKQADLMPMGGGPMASMRRKPAQDTYFTCVSFPFSGKPQIAHHLPFMGEKGMDYLRECKELYFDKLEI